MKTAKGKASVDYVTSVPEPSATDRPTEISTAAKTTSEEKAAKSSTKGGTKKAAKESKAETVKCKEENEKKPTKRKLELSTSGNVKSQRISFRMYVFVAYGILIGGVIIVAGFRSVDLLSSLLVISVCVAAKLLDFNLNSWKKYYI